MADDASFAEQLQTQREARALTPGQLAQQANLRPTAVPAYESAACRPPRDAAEKLAQALDLDDEATAAFLNAAGHDPQPDDPPPQPVNVNVNMRIEHLHGRATGVDYHAPGAPPTPLQRPTPAEHFTGREQTLDQLLRALRPGRRATLHGPGGIGKTSLAAEALACLAPLHRPPADFPGGVLFHSFYNRPEAAVALEHIARSLGEDPRPDPAAAAQRALANRRLLLVLDGAEAADDLPAVMRAAGPHCAVLVTTRSLRDVVGRRLDVGPLPLPRAVALLHKWAGDDAGPSAEDEAAARAVCDLCGRLPLALRVAGRYMAQQGEPVRDYARWMQASPLAALDHGERRHESVNVLLQKSVDVLNPTARHALALFGRLALAPVTRLAVAAALTHESGGFVKQAISYIRSWLGLGSSQPPRASVSHEHDARRPLDELTAYALLQRSAAGYEVTHALVHTYARSHLDLPEETLVGVAAYYNKVVREAWAQGPEGYDALAAARPHVLALMEHLQEVGAWAAVNDLAWAVHEYLNLLGYAREWLAVCERGLAAARALEHRRDEGAWLNNLGLAHGHLGQASTAIDYHEQALAISRDVGDRRAEGNRLGNLGNAYADLGETRKAIDTYEQALAISRDVGDRRAEGADLGNLGVAYHHLGETRKAIDYYQQALAIARDTGDRRGEGNRLGNLGVAYDHLGELERAMSYWSKALTIAREIGDRHGESVWLDNLGAGYRKLGDLEQSVAHHERALAIAQEGGFKLWKGSALQNLGEVCKALGQRERAVDYAQRALALYEEIESPYAEEARALLQQLEDM